MRMFFEKKEGQEHTSSQLPFSARPTSPVILSSMPRTCNQEGCLKRPSFNYSGEILPLFCSFHALENMVDVSTKTCQQEGCRIHPSFNFPDLGNKVGIFCVSHKMDGMIDVRSRKCCAEGCSVFPTFNHPNERPGRYCAQHKLAGMIDVRKHSVKKCRFEGCSAIPVYNFPTKKGSLYCAEHKLEGMQSTTRTCASAACPRHPTHNFKGNTKPLCCAEHKLDGMVYVNKGRKMCEREGCVSQPCYNYPGERGKRFCVEHKLDDMVMCSTMKKYDTTSVFSLADYGNRFCSSHTVRGNLEYGDVVGGNADSASETCDEKDAQMVLAAASHSLLFNSDDMESASSLKKKRPLCVDENERSVAVVRIDEMSDVKIF